MTNETKDKPIPAHEAALDLTLLSNFIHQVVNPLNGVAGTLDNLVEGRVEGSGRAQQRLRAARAQVEQCIALVKNLAYFAKGFSSTEPAKTIIIPQVIIEAAMFFQEEGANNKIVIALHDKHTQNSVKGHPELLRQVFMNLFDNAVKYSAPASTVDVEQRVQKKTGRVLVEVTNKLGASFTQSDLKKIFDLGFRGENARHMVASGTGLGLYICKLIIKEAYQGEMWCELINGGTQLKFSIAFPGEAGS